MIMKKTENLMILALGFCLGAVVGIFAAPTKGSITRDSMLYNLKSSKKRLQAFILKLISNKKNAINEAKTSGKEVITDLVSSAQQILKELDLLATQLEQKTE